MKHKIDLKKHSAWIIFLVLTLVFSILVPQFRTASNAITILRQVAINGIMAMGLAFILISGGFDLSTGQQLAFAGMLCSTLIVNAGLPIWISVILAILGTMLIGLVNGVAITATNMPPLIATLGMQYVVKGAAYLLTGGYPVYGLPDGIHWIGQGYLGPIPISAIIMILVILAGGFVLNKTTFGRKVFAVGSNIEAARLSGINVKLVKILVYVIGSGLMALAGIVMMSRLNSGQPGAGAELGMDIIIACVLGGISSAGGEGRVSGMLGGLLAMGVLANGMAVMGLTEYYQWLCKGAVLVIAVGLDSYRRLAAAERKTHVIRSSNS